MMLCPAHLENLKVIVVGECASFLGSSAITIHMGMKNLLIRAGLTSIESGEVERKA